MSRLLRVGLLIALAGLVQSADAQDAKKKGNRPYPPLLAGAQVETYKTVGDVKLNMYVYYPPGHKPTDKRAAAVFFFGGGWTNGSPQQFEQHCKHLASRGMVAMTADYRVASRHQVKAVSCVADAKSAIRFVRKEASRLGVDPECAGAIQPGCRAGAGRRSE
jgi:acetyl esterase/lipase